MSTTWEPHSLQEFLKVLLSFEFLIVEFRASILQDADRLAEAGKLHLMCHFLQAGNKRFNARESSLSVVMRQS
jgi:hypothetical protein